MQFDGRAFLGSQALAAGDTFVARKVRPILDGTLLGLVDFRFAPDFGNNGQIVADAYLDVHPRPWLRIRVGKFKQPYGLERLQADQDLPLIERGLDQYLTPQREVGVQLWGDIAGGLVRYELGVYNGNPDNGINDIDNNESKTLGGRIFLHPFAGERLRRLGRLGLGVAGSSGKEQGSAAVTNGAVTSTWLNGFRSPGQATIFAYAASATDPTQTVFASGRHSRINPQLYYYLGPVGLLAEWVREYQEVAQTADGARGAFNNSAGHVTLSAALGGEVSYEGVKPSKPLDLAAAGLGALELAVRYNWLHVDGAAFPVGARPNTAVSGARGVGVAANWQLSRNVKLSANYERTWFTGGGGTAATPGDRQTENVLLGRFQVAF